MMSPHRPPLRRPFRLGALLLVALTVHSPPPLASASPLLSFEYPEELCGSSWRDEYVLLHNRMREESRAAYAAANGQQTTPAAAAAEGSTSPDPVPLPQPPPSPPPPAPLPSQGGEGGVGESAAVTGPPPMPGPRLLVYDWFGDCGGLGDYLVGLATAFAWSLMDGRALVLAQPCLSTAFLPNLIDWRLTDDVPLDDYQCPRFYSLQPQLPRGGRIPAVCLDWRNKLLSMDDLHQFSGIPTVRVHTNRGILLRTIAWEGMDEWAVGFRERTRLRMPYAFGCIMRLLIKPKPEVWAMVSPLASLMSERAAVTIGMHLRVTDNDVWGGYLGSEPPKEQLDEGKLEEAMKNAGEVVECVKRINDWWYPPSLTSRWVVVTNSKPLKAKLKEEYGEKILTTDFVPYHTRLLTYRMEGFDQSQAEEAALLYQQTVAEWLLLASCHTFVIPESGFSRTAALYSMHTADIFSGECDPETFTSIRTFDTWSQI